MEKHLMQVHNVGEIDLIVGLTIGTQITVVLSQQCFSYSTHLAEYILWTMPGRTVLINRTVP